jgi:hypothetical protein
MSALKRALAVGRGEGARSLAVKVLAATCYARLTLLERMLDEPLPDLSNPLGLAFGLLTPADAEEYAELVSGASAEQMRVRLQAGDLCFATRQQGRLVGVSWAVSRSVRVPYLRGTLRVRSGDALVEGAFVAPAMRGQQVSALGGAYRLRRLREAGYRRALALILPENTAAFGPPETLGYHRIGTASGVGPGSRRMVIVVHPRTGPADERR